MLLERNTVEFMAARVAAAFGVGEYSLFNETINFRSYLVWAGIDQNGSVFDIGVRIGNRHRCWLSRYTDGHWELSHLFNNQYEGPVYSAALYRLGFEDEEILSHLPLLSAHEKLELRLSMPKEFWPESWQ